MSQERNARKRAQRAARKASSDDGNVLSFLEIDQLLTTGMVVSAEDYAEMSPIEQLTLIPLGSDRYALGPEWVLADARERVADPTISPLARRNMRAVLAEAEHRYQWPPVVDPAVGTEAMHVILRTAEVVPGLLTEVFPQIRKVRKGGGGICLLVCAVVQSVLRHYGLDAETAAVDVRCLTDASSELDERGVPFEDWPESAKRSVTSQPVDNFAGHAVVRVRFAAVDVLMDLAAGQFQAPEYGINPPERIVTGWDAGAMDRGKVSVAAPGCGRVDYTLRPDMNNLAAPGLPRIQFHSGPGPTRTGEDSLRYITDLVVSAVDLPITALAGIGMNP